MGHKLLDKNAFKSQLLFIILQNIINKSYIITHKGHRKKNLAWGWSAGLNFRRKIQAEKKIFY
jgi:hypothetical protein